MDLEQIHAQAQKTLKLLEDMNSAYPATKEFLASRGLTHVSQLDEQGRQDLAAHLMDLLAHLRTFKNVTGSGDTPPKE